MAAPVGNKNNTKNKPWADALRRALARFDEDGVQQGDALNRIAYQYVKCAVNGDKDAAQEIANRLDGKPAQSVSMDEESGPFLVEITKRIVNASN